MYLFRGLIYSADILFNKIIKFSLLNMSIAMDENIKYFVCISRSVQ